MGYTGRRPLLSPQRRNSLTLRVRCFRRKMTWAESKFEVLVIYMSEIIADNDREKPILIFQLSNYAIISLIT